MGVDLTFSFFDLHVTRIVETSPCSITCPTCFESFEVAAPFYTELPAELDYDCEVCCRPMVILFWEEDGDIVAEARGLDE